MDVTLQVLTLAIYCPALQRITSCLLACRLYFLFYYLLLYYLLFTIVFYLDIYYLDIYYLDIYYLDISI